MNRPPPRSPLFPYTTLFRSFFPAADNETRAWPLRRGETALDAAATIHTDIARGFIRCEVIRWNDLVEAGSRAEVVRRGRARPPGGEKPGGGGGGAWNSLYASPLGLLWEAARPVQVPANAT